MIGLKKVKGTEKTTFFVRHLLYKLFIALSGALITIGFVYFYALALGQNTVLVSTLLNTSSISPELLTLDNRSTTGAEGDAKVVQGERGKTSSGYPLITPTKLIDVRHNKTLQGQSTPQTQSLTKFESIIGSYYDKSMWELEKIAFKRVLSWKVTTEKISGHYKRVDTSMMLSVIKAETQGRNGNQVSSQKAVGLTQIKYQGAWAFLWDALNRKYASYDNKKKIKDYFNIGIRQRYGSHLKRIETYLKKNRIYVEPIYHSEKAFKNARFLSWKKFKRHMKKKKNPKEYQLAIDISSLYLDHLISLFHNYSQRLSAMQVLIKENIKSDLESINFKERKYSVLKQIFDQEKEIFIKEYFRQSGLVIDIEDAKKVKSVLWNKFKKSFGETLYADIGHQLIDRLEMMRSKLNNPETWYVAYNIGPSSTLLYVENGKEFPKGSLRYSNRVSDYVKIFNQLDSLEEGIFDSPQVAETEPTVGNQS